MNTENMKDAQKNIQQRRLAWRCRRGMLELDIVLQRFITQHFNQLTLGELQAFDELLDLPDNDFWLLVCDANMTHSDTEIQTVLHKMRVL